MGMAGMNVSAYDAEVTSQVATLYFNVDWGEKQATLVTCEMTGQGEISIPSDVWLPNFSYYGFSVAHIASNAFKDCTGITSIRIPGNVKSINSGAFDGCTGLISVDLQGDATFASDLFRSCSNLTTITVSNSNLYDARNDCNAIIKSSTNSLLVGCKSTVIPNTVTSIGASAFSGCTGLTAIEIPSSVTAIGDYAFNGCTGLTSIEIPSSVTSIGSSVFYGSGLTSATLNCPTVGSWIGNITTLETVTLGETVTSVNNSAFQGCTSLTTIIVDDNNTTYDSRNNCNAVIETATNTLIRGCKGTTIPNSVTTIGSSAFSNSGLTSITIPSSVTSIDNSAFRFCDDLTTITVDGGNTVYDSRNNCNAIIETATNSLVIGCNSSTIPNTVTNIAAKAFANCTDLANVTIPNSVTSIATQAFSDCIGLTSVTIGSGLTGIAYNAFQRCTSLTSIQVADGNATYDSRDDCNAIIETGTNTLALACYGTVIPSSVRTIGKRAFYQLSNLTDINIPTGVTCIADSAFEGCGLISVTIPNTVTSFGSCAFYGCSSLSSIVFDNCYPTFGINAFRRIGYTSDKLLHLTGIYYPAYAYTYYTTNEQTNVFMLYPQIKINREWTTYCATASFDVPDGIEAYVVKSYEDGVVTLKRVTTINEGEGLLLKPAEVGTFYDATLNGSPAAYESNLMKGVTEATAIAATDGEYTNFIFTNGSKGLGFYPTNSGTFPAYKAYLQISTASLSASARKGISLVFEDESTAIKSASTADSQDSDIWYTLNGLRISKPIHKGLYIHQGKKVGCKVQPVNFLLQNPWLKSFSKLLIFNILGSK